MKEDFVTYEQSVKLKELGFDWEVVHFYDKWNGKLCENQISYDWEPGPHESVYFDINGDTMFNIGFSAPTLAQVQKWLRETKDIHIEIKYTYNPQYEPWVGKVITLNNGEYIETDTCDTYEEALLECIDKSIEILENDK